MIDESMKKIYEAFYDKAFERGGGGEKKKKKKTKKKKRGKKV